MELEFKWQILTFIRSSQHAQQRLTLATINIIIFKI
jgi:hypothetical protein